MLGITYKGRDEIYVDMFFKINVKENLFFNNIYYRLNDIQIVNGEQILVGEQIVPFLKNMYLHEKVDDEYYFDCTAKDDYFALPDLYHIIKVSNEKYKDIVIFDRFFVYNDVAYTWENLFGFLKNAVVESYSDYNLKLFTFKNGSIKLKTTSGVYIVRPTDIVRVDDGIWKCGEVNGDIYILDSPKSIFLGVDKVREMYEG